MNIQLLPLLKRWSKQIGYGFLLMVAVVTLISTVVYLSPVDPALMSFGQSADKQTIANTRKALHLDEPLWKQVVAYLNDLSPLSVYSDVADNQTRYHYIRLIPLGSRVLVIKQPYLRISYQSGRPVAQIIADAFPQTAILAVVAMCIALLIGIPAGVAAALHRDTPIDRFITTITVLGISLPSYVAGILLAYLFGVLWNRYTGLDHVGSLFDYDDQGHPIMVWSHLVLPAIALGIRPVALITQLTRSAMLDILPSDYIRTARSKGLPHKRIVWRHAFRNALTPIVTATSGWFASLLTGAVFVENVFSFKGLGAVMVDHLLVYDVPVVLGIAVFIAFIFWGINTITDLIYKVVDPRMGA